MTEQHTRLCNLMFWYTCTLWNSHHNHANTPSPHIDTSFFWFLCECVCVCVCVCVVWRVRTLKIYPLSRFQVYDIIFLTNILTTHYCTLYLMNLFILYNWNIVPLINTILRVFGKQKWEIQQYYLACIFPQHSAINYSFWVRKSQILSLIIKVHTS